MDILDAKWFDKVFEFKPEKIKPLEVKKPVDWKPIKSEDYIDWIIHGTKLERL